MKKLFSIFFQGKSKQREAEALFASIYDSVKKKQWLEELVADRCIYDMHLRMKKEEWKTALVVSIVHDIAFIDIVHSLWHKDDFIFIVLLCMSQEPDFNRLITRCLFSLHLVRFWKVANVMKDRENYFLMESFFKNNASLYGVFNWTKIMLEKDYSTKRLCTKYHKLLSANGDVRAAKVVKEEMVKLYNKLYQKGEKK